MKAITLRDVIRSVPERWKKQYCAADGKWSPPYLGFDKEKIYDQLTKIDVDTCSKDGVDQIIGNTSWTDLKCDECGKDGVDFVVQVGEPPDYESKTASLCRDCISSLMGYLNGA